MAHAGARQRGIALKTNRVTVEINSRQSVISVRYKVMHLLPVAGIFARASPFYHKESAVTTLCCEVINEEYQKISYGGRTVPEAVGRENRRQPAGSCQMGSRLYDAEIGQVDGFGKRFELYGRCAAGR